MVKLQQSARLPAKAMMRAAFLAAVSAAMIVLGHQAAVALGDKVEAGSCAIANSGSASGNSVTCNFGLTPEQLKQVTEAAVKGATGPLIDRVADISKILGVTEDATKTLLKIVGEDSNVPDDKLADALSKVASDYKRLQAQVAALNPDNPTAKAFVEQAKPEIEAGHFGRAHELLRQATQAQIAAAQEADKLEQQAHAARDAQMLGAADSTAAEGDVALTERNYSEAAELFGQAANFVPRGHSSERGGYLLRQAGALYRQGDERGDNDALRNSIELYERALAEYPRSGAPLDWAQTQNNLGTALWRLGERESGTARLEAAVAAYRAALEERTRERVPLDWAQTQNNLGLALWRLGERESGTARLEEAVTAYRAALEERTRERLPLQWAQTQNNLGIALRVLGARGSGTTRLEEAVAAYRAALEEYTRGRDPLDWARAQNNLGVALEALGARESGTARLEEAVTAYRAALEERTRERLPLYWAMTEDNLGTALFSLGERESGTARLEEAVAVHRAALEERTRDRVPLDWAATQNNLGTALEALGERESGTARLEQAVDAYRAALAERARERAPLAWAASTGNQGVALMVIADRTNDPALADAAVRQIEMAYQTAQSGGDEHASAFYLAHLLTAQAIRDRLKGQSGECSHATSAPDNTADCRAAVGGAKKR
jgi:tetratricopeptide (TPR) repeat protein